MNLHVQACGGLQDQARIGVAGQAVEVHMTVLMGIEPRDIAR